MKITKEQFERLKVPHNYLVIKPSMGNHEIKLTDDLTIYIDTSYNEMQHAETKGEVVKKPGKLCFNHERGPYAAYSMEWETTDELEIGDTVIYHYLAASEAMKQDEYLDVDGVIYFFIQYEKVFIAKRGDRIIPVNGFILVEPLLSEENKKIDFLELPDSIKDNKDQQRAIVKYVGSCNTDYRANRGFSDPKEIYPGDVIIFTKNADILLQYPLHADIEGKQEFYRIQRKHVLAIVEKETVNNLFDKKSTEEVV